jgi:hypothetical protein
MRIPNLLSRHTNRNKDRNSECFPELTETVHTLITLFQNTVKSAPASYSFFSALGAQCPSASLASYLKFEPYSRIVHVERMHLPDPTPDDHVETRFDAKGTGTLMTLRMTLPDAQTCAAMLATGMEHGMETSYRRLESML